MKIGVVTDFYYPWIGGPSAVVRNLGLGLAREGHTVQILAPSPDGRPRDEIEGNMAIRRVRTIPAPFGYNLRTSVLPVQSVRQWLASARPDIVHIHHPFPLSATAAVYCHAQNIPVVATNHTIPECSLWGIRNLGRLNDAAQLAFGRWLLWVLGRCLHVATPTATAARLLHELGYRPPIEVISNGVDTDRFAPGPADMVLKMQLGLDERPVVLYTGRLDAEKQMDVWLRAAATLLEQADIQFLVGGQGAERPRLERLVQDLGIARNVRFSGYLIEDQYASLYRVADVFFITSPVELQSICTLEAVSSGLPVVAVNAGALPELVLSGENGFTVPPGDSKDAAQRLQEILGDTQVRARMAHKSRSLGLRHGLQETIKSYERFLLTHSRVA